MTRRLQQMHTQDLLFGFRHHRREGSVTTQHDRQGGRNPLRTSRYRRKMYDIRHATGLSMIPRLQILFLSQHRTNPFKMARKKRYSVQWRPATRTHSRIFADAQTPYGHHRTSRETHLNRGTLQFNILEKNNFETLFRDSPFAFPAFLNIMGRLFERKQFLSVLCVFYNTPYGNPFSCPRHARYFWRISALFHVSQKNSPSRIQNKRLHPHIHTDSRDEIAHRPMKRRSFRCRYEGNVRLHRQMMTRGCPQTRRNTRSDACLSRTHA